MVADFYFGAFPTVLDEAGRITVPRRFREIMDRNDRYTWFITPGLNGNLYLYDREQWGKLLEQNQKTHASTNQATHQFFSFGYGCTVETRVDRQGRMPVPQSVRGLIGVEREVVLVGVQDRLELWNKDAWEAFCRDMWPKFGTRATELENQNRQSLSGSQEKGGES